ncbi:hypothetical protein PR002_g6272 [Phytophthora rubi]|uniref:Secreted protein n=1 Tax=Phytophthora rubi TaxID=129364 RepID=A0A6A3N2T8_9STRA|nr:hypothetical protein PR002_g6272 [Phytophthora rubi]
MTSPFSKISWFTLICFCLLRIAAWSGTTAPTRHASALVFSATFNFDCSSTAYLQAIIASTSSWAFTCYI